MACGRSAGRDPRFDGLSGAFVDERFRKQYAFLFDDALPEEKRQLRSTLQARCTCQHVVQTVSSAPRAA